MAYSRRIYKMRKSIICCFVILLVLTASVPMVTSTSQCNVWKKLNGPYGCYVADIAADPSDPQVVYMATNMEGVYKSFDSGHTWTAINNGIPPNGLSAWDIAIDPINSQNLYLGTWMGSFFKSTDAGSTWQQRPIGDMFSTMDIAIAGTDPSILYAAAMCCVWKSTDFGETWDLKDNGFPAYSSHLAVAVDANDSNLVYAAGGAGSYCYFYKSTNGGDLWENKSNGLDTTKLIWAIAQHPTNNNILYIATENGVYKSIDRAESWIQVNDGLTNTFTRDIAIDPDNPDVLYVATWNGLFKSNNTGLSWFDISEGFKSRMVRTVDLDPSYSQVIYSGIWGGIYKSTNAGANQSFHDTGLPQDCKIADNSVVVDPTDPAVIYAGTYGGGVAKSTDGCQSFEYINNGLEMGYCCGLFIFPDRPQDLFCFTFGGPIVYKTTDGGGNWFASNSGLGGLELWDGAFDPVNSDVFYIGSDEGVYKTTNAGASWFVANNGLEGLEYPCIRDIAVDPSNNQIVYVATWGSGIFKSTDAGNLWFNSSNGISDLRTRSISIDPTNPQKLYAGTKTGIFKSIDGGNSWIPSSSGVEDKDVRCLIVNPSDPQIIYVQTRLDGMFKSINGGDTWTPFNAGLTDLYMTAITLDPENPNILYIGTGSGVFRWTPCVPGVGGIWVPVDKLGLLAPYIALAVAVVVIAVGTVYARKKWFGKVVVKRP
jgi:photosystem II stability/assembly factor-like uncharacterized protein